MVNINDEEAIKELIVKSYPNITQFESEHMRFLFCGECAEILNIDKPNGPFLKVGDCICEVKGDDNGSDT
jgi:hypothetical protein